MKPEKIKVLFVDDASTIRSKARQLFKRLKINNYHEANDGKIALEMVEKAEKDGERFDLILSDLNMQEMNGFEFLKMLRRHENLKIQKTKFIIVTTTPENVLIAIDLGANQCLHKPFDEKELGLRLVWVFGEEWEGENFVLPEIKLNPPSGN